MNSNKLFGMNRFLDVLKNMSEDMQCFLCSKSVGNKLAHALSHDAEDVAPSACLVASVTDRPL